MWNKLDKDLLKYRLKTTLKQHLTQYYLKNINLCFSSRRWKPTQSLETCLMIIRTHPPFWIYSSYVTPWCIPLSEPLSLTLGGCIHLLVCDINRTPNCYGKTWRFLCPFFRNPHLRENLARDCFTSTVSTVTNSVQNIFTHLRYCDKYTIATFNNNLVWFTGAIYFVVENSTTFNQTSEFYVRPAPDPA